MKQKIALVTDFDGTITFEDFFWHIANKYFDEQSLEPWREYLSGKMSHINALNAMFSGIRIDNDEFIKFIKEIKFDKNFEKTVKLCQEQNIPVIICSAGCDYYINIMIGDIIKNYDIKVVTNHGVYDDKKGLIMIPPAKDSPYYDEKVGISKSSIVKKLHSKGYEVIFAGDGPPDFEPAKIAEVVFARKMLLEKCIEAGIKTKKFDSYMDIYNYIKEL